MRDLYLRTVVRLVLAVDWTDRHETDVEHAVNELLLELPHLTEQLPNLVALILN